MLDAALRRRATLARVKLRMQTISLERSRVIAASDHLAPPLAEVLLLRLASIEDGRWTAPSSKRCSACGAAQEAQAARHSHVATSRAA
jgi:hypothetical protein